MVNCKSCGKSLGVFTSSKTCCKCGAKVCRDCAIRVDGYKYEDQLLYLAKLSDLDNSKLSWWSKSAYFCKSCANAVLPKINRIASCSGNRVRTYTINYQGHKPSRHSTLYYQTEYYKSRESAFQEIKIVAEYLGSNAVVDVELLREVEEDGNYKYTIWSAKGYILLN